MDILPHSKTSEHPHGGIKDHKKRKEREKENMGEKGVEARGEG